MDRLERNRRLTGAAAIVMFATFMSRITGFLRTLLIYTRMRPGGYSDDFMALLSRTLFTIFWQEEPLRQP